jgi:hypothetical protein
VRRLNAAALTREQTKYVLEALFTNRFCGDATGREHRQDRFARARVLDILGNARKPSPMAAIAEDIGADRSTTHYWKDLRIARAERTSAVAKPSVNLLYTGWSNSRASPRRSCAILSRAKLNEVRSSQDKAPCWRASSSERCSLVSAAETAPDSLRHSNNSASTRNTSGRLHGASHGLSSGNGGAIEGCRNISPNAATVGYCIRGSIKAAIRASGSLPLRNRTTSV